VVKLKKMLYPEAVEKHMFSGDQGALSGVRASLINHYASFEKLIAMDQ